MENLRKFWFYIEIFLILVKKSVKIGKIVSRRALKSLKKDQISQKPRIITNKDIYVLHMYITGFCAFRKCMPLFEIIRGLGKKIIYIFLKICQKIK